MGVKIGVSMTTLRDMRFHGDAWDTPMAWHQDGSEDRVKGRRGNFLSPYRPMPEIIEREAGAVLKECWCCASFREDVREMNEDGVEACRACWP